MLAEPVGEFGLGEFTGCKGDERDDDFGIACRQIIAVEHQEGFRDDGCGALVAINKRMVACDAIGVSGGKCGGIRVAIGDKVLRTRQRAGHQTCIAHALTPAVFGQLLGMRRLCHCWQHPNPIAGHDYLASSRKARLRRAITSRAAAICASKSGSAVDSSIPRGVSTTDSVSPTPALRWASSSLGRIIPAELPTLVILMDMFIRTL